MMTPLVASLVISEPQIAKNDLRNGNITRDQLIAHAFLLVVRPRSWPLRNACCYKSVGSEEWHASCLASDEQDS